MTDEHVPTDPVFIDFEASGLGPDSFPIEVGWAFAGAEIRSEGHLLRPMQAWLEATHAWDPASETVHGIALATLVMTGEHPVDVANRLNSALRGRMVITDSPGNDLKWAWRLFDGVGLAPAFRILDIPADAFSAIRARELGLSGGEMLALEREAIRLAPRTHRAEQDARSLATLWWLMSRRNDPTANPAPGP